MEFWRGNHKSSLKVYYSDEMDVVAKSVTKTGIFCDGNVGNSDEKFPSLKLIV